MQKPNYFHQPKLLFSFIALFLFSFSVYAAKDAVPGEYLVQFKNPNNNYSKTQLEAQLRAEIVRPVRSDILLVKRMDSREKVLTEIQNHPAVKRVEPNYIYKIIGAPNDPEFIEQWALKNIGRPDKDGIRGLSGVDIGVERAWDITTGSRKVVVAVIDTGVDFSIPDLRHNAWVNVKEKNGQAGVDDDDNGYVDDIHGYNFDTFTADPTDDHGHGSHCAGVIGAKGNDGDGMAGVAWDVQIMAVKFLDADGGGTLEGAVKAIDYATDMGADIMSNSWGGSMISQILEEAVGRSSKNGALFVAAAGNEGMNNDSFPSFPANYEFANVVSVAAIDNRGGLASFSNYGPRNVDIAAPGVNVKSTVPGGFEIWSGTSMATPHVAGVAALLKSQNEGMRYAALKERLLKTARPLSSVKGRVVSSGIVDAYYALTNETPPSDPYDPTNWTSSQAAEFSTPHPYGDKFVQEFKLTIPGAKFIALHFSKFDTEAGFDKLQLYNSDNELVGSVSGKRDGSFSPIVDGDTVIMKFESDDSVSGYGFDIDHAVFQTE